MGMESISSVYGKVPSKKNTKRQIDLTRIEKKMIEELSEVAAIHNLGKSASDVDIDFEQRSIQPDVQSMYLGHRKFFQKLYKREKQKGLSDSLIAVKMFTQLLSLMDSDNDNVSNKK